MTRVVYGLNCCQRRVLGRRVWNRYFQARCWQRSCYRMRGARHRSSTSHNMLFVRGAVQIALWDKQTPLYPQVLQLSSSCITLGMVAPTFCGIGT